MDNNDRIQLHDIVNLSDVFAESQSDITPHIEGNVFRVSEDEILVKTEDGHNVDLLGIDATFFPIPIFRGGRWGYADKSGHIVIPFDFVEAAPFKNGRAYVFFDTHSFNGFYIDVNGAWVDTDVEHNNNDMPIYVLQEEPTANREGDHKNILGIFRRFEDAMGHLNQRRSLYRPDFFDIDTPVYFNQADCYWDGRHHLTIQKRYVSPVATGNLIYSIVFTLKANVIEIPHPAVFFSRKEDVLDFLGTCLGKTDPKGLADFNYHDGQTESEEYILGVFSLQ